MVLLVYGLNKILNYIPTIYPFVTVFEWVYLFAQFWAFAAGFMAPLLKQEEKKRCIQ